MSFQKISTCLLSSILCIGLIQSPAWAEGKDKPVGLTRKVNMMTFEGHLGKGKFNQSQRETVNESKIDPLRQKFEMEETLREISRQEFQKFNGDFSMNEFKRRVEQRIATMPKKSSAERERLLDFWRERVDRFNHSKIPSKRAGGDIHFHPEYLKKEMNPLVKFPESYSKFQNTKESEVHRILEERLRRNPKLLDDIKRMLDAADSSDSKKFKNDKMPGYVKALNPIGCIFITPNEDRVRCKNKIYKLIDSNKEYGMQEEFKVQSKNINWNSDKTFLDTKKPIREETYQPKIHSLSK